MSDEKTMTIREIAIKNQERGLPRGPLAMSTLDDGLSFEWGRLHDGSYGYRNGSNPQTREVMVIVPTQVFAKTTYFWVETIPQNEWELARQSFETGRDWGLCESCHTAGFLDDCSPMEIESEHYRVCPECGYVFPDPSRKQK